MRTRDVSIDPPLGLLAETRRRRTGLGGTPSTRKPRFDCFMREEVARMSDSSGASARSSADRRRHTYEPFESFE